MPADGGVVLLHPAKQHAYEVAVALQQAGLLRQFITGIYYKPATFPYSATRYLPGRLSRPVLGELGKRIHPGLNPAAVRSWPYAEILSRTVGRQPWIDRLSGGRSGFPFSHWLTDVYASTVVGRMQPRPWGIYGFEAGALHTFTRARARGIQTIYDVPIVRNAADIVLGEYRSLNLAIASRGLAARPSRRELALADWVVTPSEAVADSVRREGFRGRGLFVVPFGVDTTVFTPAGRAPQRGRFRAVFAGRLEVRKGLHFLLDAWRDAALDADLVLAGSIGEPEFVEGLRRRYAGLFTEAGNLGRRELAALLASADVFVLPSLAEGSALVSYEALACGLPCIVTAEAGSVVRDGVEGFIVPARDSGAIRRRLDMLYADRQLRDRMSAAAVARAEQFSWERYHAALIEVTSAVHHSGPA